MALTALNMGSSTNSAWEDFLLGMPSPSAVHQASLSPDAQALDQVSFSDTGDLAEAPDCIRDIRTELQTVTGNHEKLSRWTVDVGATLSELAHQVVEKIVVPMAEEDEWHMPEEEQLQH
ncbi:hypothetical protein B0J14DRAFT_652809 [Halenospora varia]|nr:hypothetical protein B0J14DRAFT_652809 [Halenospora varia]